METNKIVKEIRTDYSMIKTLAVNYEKGQEFIELLGMPYEGKKENFATESQIKYLSSFNNVTCYKRNLEKTNKWFVSACIEIARKYSAQEFQIIVG